MSSEATISTYLGVDLLGCGTAPFGMGLEAGVNLLRAKSIRKVFGVDLGAGFETTKPRLGDGTFEREILGIVTILFE